MLTDLNHLLRQLRRSPASAAAAVLTLALTIGAATTIFAVVDAVLLTPPPFADPDALVTLDETPAETPGGPRMISYPTFEAWGDRTRTIARLAAFDPTNVTLTGFGPAERVSATDIDPDFLRVLGVAPQLGRAFTPGDVGQPVVIVSHNFWNGKLGGDRNAVGRTILLGGRAHTVVGVLPDGFRFPLNPADLWRPLPLTAAQAARTSFRMRAIARLSAGTTAASLERALDEISRRAVPSARARAVPFATAIARGSATTLALLAGAAALAMLIAFGETAAVGRQIWLTGPRRFVDVVGVVDDITHRALDEDPMETVYLSAWQEPSRSSHIVVRSARSSDDVVAIVRQEVARLDAELPVYAPRSMDDVVAASAGMAGRRILTAAFSWFAILALVLSVVGLFGVVAHDVTSRRPELAVRVALGATPARLVTATLRQGATLVGAGVASGMVLSVWWGRLLSAFAPVPAQFDLASTAAAAGLLLTVGVCAVLPAGRRAARTDPVAALRS